MLACQMNHLYVGSLTALDDVELGWDGNFFPKHSTQVQYVSIIFSENPIRLALGFKLHAEVLLPVAEMFIVL